MGPHLCGIFVKGDGTHLLRTAIELQRRGVASEHTAWHACLCTEFRAERAHKHKTTQKVDQDQSLAVNADGGALFVV